MLKVTVLGTSNSVIKEGWIKGLNAHDSLMVSNISSGRVPCLSIITKLIEHRQTISNSDILVVDHYVNDMMFYLNVMGPSYLSYIEDAYRHLKATNKKIVILFLPIFKIGQLPTSKYFMKIKALCDEYHFQTLDFSNAPFKEESFLDQFHLKNVVACSLGETISKNIASLEIKTRDCIADVPSPFEFYNYQSIISDSCGYSITDLIQVTNSLGKFKYLPLKKRISLSKFKGMNLVAISYFNTNDSHHFSIGHSKKLNVLNFQTTGSKYFIELIRPITIFEDTYIEFNREHCYSDAKVVAGRNGDPSIKPTPLGLSGLLFRN